MPSTLLDTFTPSEQDTKQAKTISSDLHKGNINISDLPEIAVKLLTYALREFAEGNAVSLVRDDADMNAQEAADYIGISRAHLFDLLIENQIPYYKVKNQRYFKREHVVAFKKQLEA